MVIVCGEQQKVQLIGECSYCDLQPITSPSFYALTWMVHMGMSLVVSITGGKQRQNKVALFGGTCMW